MGYSNFIKRQKTVITHKDAIKTYLATIKGRLQKGNKFMSYRLSEEE